MTNFSNLGLSAALLKALPELNIEQPTQIQQQAIPLLVQHKERDFLGLAQTGTGKTAAFGLPLLEAIDPKQRQTQALVLAPTRELGQQIGQQLQAFSKYMDKLNVQVVYGGASIVPQIKALKNTPHIVIATPGRLIDLLNRKALNLKDIKHVVFDEADEMLNMGFRDDIDLILSHMKGEKSTWLFSATLAPELKSIVNKYMTDPLEVKVDVKNVVNTNIEHKYFLANAKDKPAVLKRIIQLEPDMRGIIFCRTKRETQALSDQLQSQGLPVDAIHGDLSQNQRDQVMKRFKQHKLEFLLATDVAARGIDVNDLTHVIHYSLPDDLEYYTHRSGRTGRAGKQGISLALLNRSEQNKVKRIEKQLKINFSAYDMPEATDIQNKAIKDWAKQLVNQEVNKELVSENLTDVLGLFEGLTREDLLARLITQHLEKLGIQKEHAFETDQMMESSGGGKNSEFSRFFINIGIIDGVERGEMLNILTSTIGVGKNMIGQLTIEERKSYFEIKNEVSHLVLPAFEGLFIDDRKLKVALESGRKGGNDRSKKNRSRNRMHKHKKGRAKKRNW